MSDLSTFPIAAKWPPLNPDKIQLYSFPTPNGVKISSVLDVDSDGSRPGIPI
jgi:GST-like protein